MNPNRTVIIFFSVVGVILAVLLPLIYVHQKNVRKNALLMPTPITTQNVSSQQAQRGYYQGYQYPTAVVQQQSAPAPHMTVDSISSTTGLSKENTPLTVRGSGFVPGTVVYFFIKTVTGQDFFKTAQTVSLSPNQIDVLVPYLGSGIFTVGVMYGNTKVDGPSYTVNLENPSPALIPLAEFASVSWDLQPDYSTYYNPRIYSSMWDAGLAPANDDVSATQWCKAVPNHQYINGSSHTNGMGSPENYKYRWDGSKWVRMINGDYARYYQCM
ncbi:MAG: hypothetical protein PHG25_01380 [Candidatus Pacebacteria bacterium]|nr:hypothetical protein [Candidatus Paceibacterota bacterium]